MDDTTRRLLPELRPLLLTWDAIGVADLPEADDEYDCLVGPLLAFLGRGDDASALRAWLAHERAEHFGLGRDDAADRALARALVDWYAGTA
jgi:hypothetical protein